MTSHELAKKLLSLPDVIVLTDTDDWGTSKLTQVVFNEFETWHEMVTKECELTGGTLREEQIVSGPAIVIT